MSKRHKDSLEQFIRQNRKSMDQFDVPFGLWEKIADQLEEDEQADDAKEAKFIRIRYRTLWQVAAAVLLLLGLFGVYSLSREQSSDQPIAQSNIQLDKIHPELGEAERYYTQLISQKRQEIAQYLSRSLTWMKNLTGI
ncbi:MAG: hypothetical protein HC880_19780 [Bacteroidia bacterium]|nr:hypothetical protein [Bacteroidia bacterium]